MNFLKIVTFFFNNFVIVSFGLYPKRDTDILPPCSVRILTVMLGKIGVEGATPPNIDLGTYEQSLVRVRYQLS